MTEKYGFVYIWYDRDRKMYYIGCHWGTETDGYICSSDRMRKSYRSRPQDFKRKVLKSNIGNRSVLLEEEFKWLSKIKPSELGRKYYNHNNHNNHQFGHWSKDPERRLSVGQRMSEVNKGRKHNLTEEERRERGRLISESKQRRRTEKEALGLPIYNKTENWRPVNLGKTPSVESNQRRSDSMKKARAEGRNTGTSGKKLRKRTREEIDHLKSKLSGKTRTPEQKQAISESNKKAWAEGKWASRKSNNMKEYIWVIFKNTQKRSRIKPNTFDPAIHTKGKSLNNP